jgi:DNA-directed RNA polymerase alpha subunit
MTTLVEPLDSVEAADPCRDFAQVRRTVDWAESEHRERSRTRSSTETLAMPIVELPLPPRTLAVLEAEKFTTVGDLAGITRQRLLRIDGIAERTADAITAAVGRVLDAAAGVDEHD